MADIRLTVNGDSSGGVAALQQTGRAADDMGRAVVTASKTSADEIGKAAAKWTILADLAKQAALAVMKFGADSVKAYAESERVSAQLARTAGGLTEVFEAQAQALMRKNAVDDDLVKRQQTLLLQWGAAPAQIEETTQAILDYATATGKDAVSATTDIIKGVETGGERLKSLGITYVQTGDKTKDLAALTKALAAKFGGAAQTDADSLVGGTRAAALAFDDLGKAFGEFIATAGQRTGILGALTEAMRDLNASMGGDVAKNKADRKAGLITELKQLGEALVAGEDAWNKSRETWNKDLKWTSFDEMKARLVEVSALLANFDKALPKTGKTGGGGGGGGAPKEFWDPGGTKLGGDIDEQGGPTSGYARLVEQETQALAEALEEQNKVVMKALEDEQKMKTKAQQEDFEQFKAGIERQEKELKDAQERTRKQEEEWAAIGDQVGAALVNAMADQIAKLSSGEEIDIGEMIGDIMASIVSIAATAIGSAYGQPALGAAIGNLAAMGITAASRRRKHHDGGWIDESDPPRFHSGAWVGMDEQTAILQTGERVLSRREVGAMGGPAAVDNAVSRGRGGGVTVNVSSLDAKSTAEAFEDQSGRGIWRAIRSGHGDMARLFGGAL